MHDWPLTDLGYSHRLVQVHGDELRFVAQWRRWLVWDGARWAPDTTGQVYRWMKLIARRVHDAAIEGNDKERQAISRRAESNNAIKGALALAATHSRIAVGVDQLDADPMLLNCLNGTLDLRTGSLREHDPADLITKVTGAEYRQGADSPLWMKFLDRVQPDPQMREYLARLVGLALEGRVSAHVLPIHHGEGGNGKSTFFDTITMALGDYAGPADPDLLLARSFDAHPTGVADLHGLRLAVLHEADRGRRLAEATVKRLTGGDRIKARRMREDFWSFDPSHTFMMLTNYRPLVGGTDEAIWRRLRLIPWSVTIPADERDDTLKDHLGAELDAVLAWLVAGHQQWRRTGLDDPKAVIEATGEYRADSDALVTFLDERCLIGLHFHVQSSELFAAWRAWCARNGHDPGTQKAFSTSLQNRGYDIKKTKVGNVWQGIGLQSDDGDGGGL